MVKSMVTTSVSLPRRSTGTRCPGPFQGAGDLARKILEILEDVLDALDLAGSLLGSEVLAFKAALALGRGLRLHFF